MKKTLTVNLGGTVYHIDEDAYHLLDNYLSNLKNYFRRRAGVEEIVADMETRIAELFAEKVTAGKQVITIEDVEEVIARMGEPEDFDIEEDEEEKSSRGAHAKKEAGQAKYTRTKVERRFFRDPDHKMLGGVAAGLAAYLEWDITLVRVLMIVLAVVPYWPMVILYIICWIFVPEARTAEEKLSMRGEAVTIESIGKTVTDNFERMSNQMNDYVNSGKPRSFLKRAGDLLADIAAVIFKIILVLLIIICFPVLFVLALGLVVLIVVGVISLVTGGTVLLQTLTPPHFPFVAYPPSMWLISSILLILIIGIPLGGLLHSILRQLFHWQPMGKGAKWTLFILWFMGAVAFVCYFNYFGRLVHWILCGIS
jgi:phage shock protein PspC (stress-responsive transcriptional regulator)